MPSEAEYQRLAQLPEVNPFPVLRCDDAGRIVYRNPAARDVKVGHSDQDISDLLPPNFPLRVRRLIDEDKTVIGEVHKSLGRTLSFTYKPLSDQREIFVVIVDVTEHVEAVQECRTYATELEATNRRLREMQAELVQSEKMAALGNLVSGVVHEINSPLGAVQSNNDTILRSVIRMKSIRENTKADPEDSQSAAFARFIRTVEELGQSNKTAIQRIVTILGSLKSFARLDRAQEDEFDLHEGIESALTLMQHELRDRVEVHKELGTLPLVRCFPAELNQVFMNLLVNAAQAIEHNGAIMIRTYTEDNFAVVKISDTGKGIPQENLSRIFEPGFTTKGVGTGVGLGLGIAYRIVQHHNGSIEVASEPGKGTTISVRLPIARSVEG